MSKRKKLVAPVFIVAILATNAVCAGEETRVRSAPWEGFYAGGHVSGKVARSDAWPFSTQTLAPDIRERRSAFGSVLGGLQVGFSHVFDDRVLVGGEADVSFPEDLRAIATVYSQTAGAYRLEDRLEAFGTLRGRIGLVSGNWLAYLTGGFAIARGRLERRQLAASPAGGAGVSEAFWQWRYGLALGIGGEVRLSSDWSARLEYLHLNFGRGHALFPIAGERYASGLSSHSVRFGLNYWFGQDARRQDAGRRAGATVGILGDIDNWSIHGQTTVIGQNAFRFPALYSGVNSLDYRSQLRNTLSASAFVGVRLPTGTEIYVTPEIFQGFGLSLTHGLAGFPNGEAQKSGFAYPHYNTSRLFARHVIGLGGETEQIEDGPNQVASKYDVSRITLTAGKISIPDLFDANAFSHDPRTGFLNWALMDAGAFDYVADQKGFTWGAAVELNQKDWAARIGYFLAPSEPNSNKYDTRLGRRGQYLAELEGRYSLFGQPGKLRLTAWHARAWSGNFDAAFYNAVSGHDIAITRRARPSHGFIANLEQAVTDDLGVFSRVSWRSGTTEILAWTDIDKSVSLGGVLKGTSWGRPADRIGVAAVVNGISGAYRRYLATGGLGLNIGDGALSYRREKIVEAYYSIGLAKNTSLTFDYQHIVNPGYNADRGPVSIASARFHTEF